MKILARLLMLMCLILPGVMIAGCSDDMPESVASLQSSARESGVYRLECHNKSGQLKWQESSRNALADGGERLFLDVTLRGAAKPTGYELRLWNDTPTETDTIATLTGEPTTGGYSPRAVEASTVGWPTLAIDNGDYQALSKTVIWTATGGTIGPVTCITLSTAETGNLVSYAPLSAARTLLDGDSLTVTYRLKMQ